MYKLLLCWRYLRTRYIAIVSIISVMLGVAAMIIVNSVMAGFSRDMQGRIRGIICDVVLESGSLEGMRDFDWHAEQVRKIVGDQIEDMTPICFVPAMLTFRWHGTLVTNQVNVIGIDEKSQGRVSDFAKYLQHPENRREFSFNLRDGGYDVYDHLAEGASRPREAMRKAGWEHRREVAQELAYQEKLAQEARGDTPVAPPSPSNSAAVPPMNPFDRRPPSPDQVKTFDMAKEPCTGVVLGIAQASFRTKDGEDHFRVLPGDDVDLSFPTAGAAEDLQRQVHYRRFLREQNARVRSNLRLHAHQGTAKAARHG